MTKLEKRFVSRGTPQGPRLGGPISPGLLSSSSYTFKSGLTRKQKKIFALVKLMKKLNDRRSFFTAKIPVPEFETKPTPRPKNKDRGQI